MEIRILGPLEAMGDDHPLPLGGPRQRAVLANLVVRANQVVPVDTLTDEVWGEDPPRAATATLHSYVSRLRRVLGTDRIEWSGPGYVCHLAADEVDASRFESLIRRARARIVTEPAAAAHAFEEAMRLWRDRPLAELAERGALMSEVARLDELRADAAEEWLGVELAVGNDDRVVANSEPYLAEYPLRERLWMLRMHALYRVGRQADALAVYQRLREVLVDDLGLDPSPEVEDLQRRILSHDPELGARGVRLHGYRLVEPLGEGMFGIVYRAIQPHVGREVALKAVRPSLAHDPDFIRRFEVEARLVARLEHPRIVPLYDSWRDEYGAFLVMRWLRGGSLRDALRSGPLPIDRAAAILEQVGEALAASHRAGVVHRDLRPANVLLDEEGNAYLSDFGIARDLAVRGLAADGAAADAYASPEELRGEPTTPRTDVFGLAVLAVETLTGRSPWRDTDRTEPVPPSQLGDAMPAALDGIIGRALAREPGDRPATIDELVAGLRMAIGTPSAVRSAPRRNPFKGLRAFGESDERDFFGRSTIVAQLVSRLADPGDAARLLAVVGPSGSGKSSVVFAGLLPALRSGAIPGSERWYTATVLPGGRPLRQLEEALRGVAAAPPTGLASMLAHAPDGLSAAVDAVLPGDASELVLVIDQLEELFTLADEADRSHLLDLLARAILAPTSRLRVVVTLRADFYDRPLAHRAFGALIGARTQVLTPPSPTELEEAIVGPLGVEGIAAQPALVAALVAQTLDRPGGLPLLQHTLSELFDTARDGTIDHAALVDLGGVAGAIARRAEEVHAALSPVDRATAREVFLRLVTVSDAGEVTRRRAARAELDALAEPDSEAASVASVIESFGRHRFLTFDHDPATRAPTVEIAHEALIAAWDRLAGWIADARDGLRSRQRLTTMADGWRTAARDPSYLARGTQLAQFEDAGSDGAIAVAGLEREYLDASIAARDAERDAERARVARERALERRSVTRLRLLAAALATGGALAVALAVFGFNQAQAAQREARLATARELAAAAVANLAVDPDLSIHLAVAAVEATRARDGMVVREAHEALHRAVLASRVVARHDADSGGPLDHAGTAYARPDGTGSSIVDAWSDAALATVPTGVRVFHLGGERLAALTSDGRIVVWGIPAGDELFSFDPADRPVDDLALSPDGTRLAVKWIDAATVWAVPSGRTIFEIPFSAPDGHGIGLDWNHDGTLLAIAAGAAESETIVVSASDGARVATLPGFGRTARFSPDASVLLTTDEGVAAFWDTSTWELRHELGHRGWVDASAFDADGTIAATGADDGLARVWDVATGEERLTLAGPGGRIGAVAIDGAASRLAGWSADAGVVWDLTPAGQRVVATVPNPHGFSFTVGFDGHGRMMTGGEGGAMLWTAGGDRLVDFVGHEGPVADITVSNDGQLVATAGFDGTVRLWTDDGEPRATLAGHEGRVWGVSFSPNGSLLASSSEDGTGRIWDVASGALVTTFGEHGAAVWDIAWSPAGSTVVSVGDDAAARVWDPHTGRQVHALTGHEGSIIEQDFDPSGTRVATAGLDGTARVWDVSDGTQLFALVGHSGIVADVAASPDGTRWATASFDGTVRLWDGSTGTELLTLEAQPEGAGRIAFGSDGDRIAVAGGGSIRIYTLDVGELIRIARERVARPLTEGECRQYLRLETCPP